MHLNFYDNYFDFALAKSRKHKDTYMTEFGERMSNMPNYSNMFRLITKCTAYYDVLCLRYLAIICGTNWFESERARKNLVQI